MLKKYIGILATMSMYSMHNDMPASAVPSQTSEVTYVVAATREQCSVSIAYKVVSQLHYTIRDMFMNSNLIECFISRDATYESMPRLFMNMLLSRYKSYQSVIDEDSVKNELFHSVRELYNECQPYWDFQRAYAQNDVLNIDYSDFIAFYLHKNSSGQYPELHPRRHMCVVITNTEYQQNNQEILEILNPVFQTNPHVRLHIQFTENADAVLNIRNNDVRHLILSGPEVVTLFDEGDLEGQEYNAQNNLVTVSMYNFDKLKEFKDHFLSNSNKLIHVFFPSFPSLVVLGAEFLAGCSSLRTAVLDNLHALEQIRADFMSECTSLGFFCLPELPNLTYVECLFMDSCDNLSYVRLPIRCYYAFRNTERDTMTETEVIDDERYLLD